MNREKLLVVGGGAAGLFCAVNAARMNPGLSVTILEKTGKLLGKVGISGGGRCNVTHDCDSVAPRGQQFLKKSFHQFFTADIIRWFGDRGVVLKTEADGRMFPVTDSSATIINCLLREADKYGVSILMGKAVRNIETTDGSEQFKVHLSNGDSMEANYVCIASGGFHREDQYNWLKGLGHTIVPPVPSLFTFNAPQSGLKSLMGVSVEHAFVKIKGTAYGQQGPLLITHWGFSGPAVLKLSAFAARDLWAMSYKFTIAINWLGNSNESEILRELKALREHAAKKMTGNKNPFRLPARLWDYHLSKCGIEPAKNWADLPARQVNLLAKSLCADEFEVSGKTTFKEEFVTAGGVALDDISANTMESKEVPNLFFAGEIMDVDGITGGFNFQHAWTSGYVAAKAISERSKNE